MGRHNIYVHIGRFPKYILGGGQRTVTNEIHNNHEMLYSVGKINIKCFNVRPVLVLEHQLLKV